jgi:hypothetical protein
MLELGGQAAWKLAHDDWYFAGSDLQLASLLFVGQCCNRPRKHGF